VCERTSLSSSGLRSTLSGGRSLLTSQCGQLADHSPLQLAVRWKLVSSELMQTTQGRVTWCVDAEVIRVRVQPRQNYRPYRAIHAHKHTAK